MLTTVTAIEFCYLFRGCLMYSDALKKDEAIRVAKAWVASHVDAPAGYRGWNQFRWLMDQLAAGCIAESLKNGEDEDQLCDRLHSGHDILWNVWHAGAPEIATRWWKEGEKPSEAQRKIIDGHLEK
jgi:hypothetical protein